MADITKYRARVPIVPDDFENKDEHKDHELVMDFNENDLYVKEHGGYVNITGRIKDAIKEIQDGSVVIHIVTEDSLPPIKDREENHWYYVITESEVTGKGAIATNTYVYYGVVHDYSKEKNYILISQNVASESMTLKFTLEEGYHPCVYIPVSFAAIFKLFTTKEEIPYHIEDRIYTLNNTQGTFVAYDVFVLDTEEIGDVLIDMILSGSNTFHISFNSNIPVQGLILPDDYDIDVGGTLGKLPDEPTKDDPNYIFAGWSRSRLGYEPVTSSYKPEEDMTLYAWYNRNEDPTLVPYYAMYVSETGVSLGYYNSVAKLDTLILPKNINGYIAPDGLPLTEPGQVLAFTYSPIHYNISYELDNGHFEEGTTPRFFFTVEDEYTPPAPIKADARFAGWQPLKIYPGTTGDFVFSAMWTDKPIFVSGSSIHSIIETYMHDHVIKIIYVEDIDPETGGPIRREVEVPGSIEDIMSIQICPSMPGPEMQIVNLSSSVTPIYGWYNNGTFMLYSFGENIVCSSDMSGAFEDFTKLRDISDFETFECKPGTVLDRLFKNCTVLSDVSALEYWADGELTLFNEAFKGTAALASSRTPSWYKWLLTIKYISTSGLELDSVEDYYIPNQTLLAKSFAGYTTLTQELVIDDKDAEYIFEYRPKIYDITYVLNGGSIVSPKTAYTIEDESYYPPNPTRVGYMFTGWSPTHIEQGEYGNVSFVANFIPNSN